MVGAYAERLFRSVAVKVVKAEHVDDATVRLRFEKEARAVAKIDHPGIIAVHDCGELEDGSLFMVMELLAGHDRLALPHLHRTRAQVGEEDVPATAPRLEDHVVAGDGTGTTPHAGRLGQGVGHARQW